MSREQEQQMQAVEITIDQAKEAIDFKTSVLRLTQNKDFRKVFDDGYFYDEAARLVLLLADDKLQSKKSQKQINLEINAIGRVREFIRVRIQMGTNAENALASHENTREELAEEMA